MAMQKRQSAAPASQTEHIAGGKVSAAGMRIARGPQGGPGMSASESQVTAVMAAALRAGLLGEKSGRIGGRVSPALVERAKARTGIRTDTDLIEFALANIALEDRFTEAFKAARGAVDADLFLGL